MTQVQIINLAASRIGVQPITTFPDATNPTAVAANTWWVQAVSTVSRSAPWSCLMKRLLVDPVVGYPPAVISGTIPAYLYEWSAEYALPADFLRMVELNGNDVWGANACENGDLFEIYGQAILNPHVSGSTQPFVYGPALFANPTPDPTTAAPPQADFKYIPYVTDPTLFDPLFVDCLACLLSARMATVIRKDDAQMAQAQEQEYLRVLLPRAQKLNGNEGKPRRYSLVSESRFLQSRWSSTAG